MAQQKDVTSITIKFEDGTEKVLTQQAMVAYIEGEDMHALFAEVDHKDLDPMINGLTFSLKLAQKQVKKGDA